MSLQDFFSAASVAVVGASRDEAKTGHQVLAAMMRGGYEGDIYPVNREAEEIAGLRCYASLTDIGTVPELVVVVVPAKAVPPVLEECVKLGAKSVIIISAGFREAGPEGEKLERSLARIVGRSEVRFLGPNCLGLVSLRNKLNASFAGDLPPVGGIGYLSQSGSLLASILDLAVANDLGFSRLVSIGNKANIDELDVLRALGEDPDTTVIAGYLETITDGDAFAREAERVSRTKPILLMKAAETDAGAEAASFHTGRMARSEVAYESMFARTGMVRCASIKEQFDCAAALANQPLPAGPAVAVVANAGGPSIMASDAIERQGLTLAQLSDDTTRLLSEGLPAAASVHNPIDLLGDALTDRFELAVNAVLADPAVDSLLLVLSPHAMTECDETAEMLVRVSQNTPLKPILACFLGAQKVAGALKTLRLGKVPRYDCPESAIAALKSMYNYARWRSRPKRVVKLFPVNRRKVERIIDRRLRRKTLTITETEAHEILEAYGFVTPKGAVANSADQAANFADQIGYPVAVKIWSPDILNKSEVGGVKLGLANRQDVVDAFDLMMYRIPKSHPEADILGVLVQQMCTGGREVILGMHRDRRFGPLMMFGMGGELVEVLKDVAFHLAPLTAEEAKEMLVSTRTYGLLRGADGREAVDIEAIAEGLQRLSQLVTEFPQIQDMEINPYIVGREGTAPVAVESRIRVGKT